MAFDFEGFDLARSADRGGLHSATFGGTAHIGALRCAARVARRCRAVARSVRFPRSQVA